jgi:hypothetical protein
MTDSTPSETLFGNEPTPAPVKGPNLLEQIVGVFTEPAALFTRIKTTPVWGGALVLLSLLNMVAGALWAYKVDADALLRPMLEQNPSIPPESYDKMIAFQAKTLLPFSILGGLLGLAVICSIMAFIYWLVSRGTSEGQPPTYKVVFSATVVSGLVQMPKAVLLAIICGLKNFGGARPEALSPTSLGFYLATENAKLQALYNTLDLFTVAGLVMTFLAARYAMRLKPLGAALCVLISAALMLLPVAFAR